MSAHTAKAPLHFGAGCDEFPRAAQSMSDRRVPRFPDDADSVALKTAHAIEDLFAQHHEGGRTQRLAKMQVLIREAMAGSK